ncbi:uncharacterized protein [Argopecten irradians]|uniref:uncharacterized protein n=1 Tax=Argopecten irradians TaxID=31199 RepID=UPI00372225E6
MCLKYGLLFMVITLNCDGVQSNSLWPPKLLGKLKPEEKAQPLPPPTKHLGASDVNPCIRNGCKIFGPLCEHGKCTESVSLNSCQWMCSCEPGWRGYLCEEMDTDNSLSKGAQGTIKPKPPTIKIPWPKLTLATKSITTTSTTTTTIPPTTTVNGHSDVTQTSTVTPTTGTDRPVTTTVTDRPVKTTGTDRPVSSTGTDRPVTTTGTDRPVTTTDTNQPVTTTGTDRPVTTTDTNQPVTTTGTDQPVTTTSSAANDVGSEAFSTTKAANNKHETITNNPLSRTTTETKLSVKTSATTYLRIESSSTVPSTSTGTTLTGTTLTSSDHTNGADEPQKSSTLSSESVQEISTIKPETTGSFTPANSVTNRSQPTKSTDQIKPSTKESQIGVKSTIVSQPGNQNLTLTADKPTLATTSMPHSVTRSSIGSTTNDLDTTTIGKVKQNSPVVTAGHITPDAQQTQTSSTLKPTAVSSALNIARSSLSPDVSTSKLITTSTKTSHSSQTSSLASPSSTVQEPSTTVLISTTSVSQPPTTQSTTTPTSQSSSTKTPSTTTLLSTTSESKSPATTQTPSTTGGSQPSTTKQTPSTTNGDQPLTTKTPSTSASLSSTTSGQSATTQTPSSTAILSTMRGVQTSIVRTTKGLLVQNKKPSPEEVVLFPPRLIGRRRQPAISATLNRKSKFSSKEETVVLPETFTNSNKKLRTTPKPILETKDSVHRTILNDIKKMHTFFSNLKGNARNTLPDDKTI